MTRRSVLFGIRRCRDLGIATEDPHVVVEDCGANWKIYRAKNGARWIIRGQCIACGECETGSPNPNLIHTGKPIGQPGAILDRTFGTRRDIPVRPDIAELPHCTLTGEYL